jgi:hypothetical protein
MREPTLKSHKSWLFCRIYAPLGMAPWLLFPGVLTSGGPDWPFLGFYPLLGFALAIISFGMLATLVDFRFNYSCFGRYKRTPWPTGKPILVTKTVRGAVGILGWSRGGSLWVWSLFPSGLGIRIPWSGRAFIALDAIQEVLRPSGGFRATLIHCSPELRNPISIPSKQIVEGIRQLLAKRQSPSHAQVNSVI